MVALNSRKFAIAALGLVALLGSVVAQTGAVDFTDVAGTAGVAFYQQSEDAVPIGAGAVWADFDRDGDDDLFLAQATGCNRLFRNLGNGLFEPIVNAGGLEACSTISHGGTAADYDNDGDQDLFVTATGQNLLFRNQLTETGFPTFVNVTVAAGMGNDGQYNSSSASWTDFDLDGDLDLFVGNHALSMMNPLICSPDYLWRNNGDGTFIDVGAVLGVAHSGIAAKDGCALATTWSDYDNDGDSDLMIINDFGPLNVPNRLFRNDGPGGPGGWLLTDVSASSGFDYAMFGMGIAVGDIDRDGDFDYYMSDVGPNDLGLNQTAQGSPTFIEIAASAGVEAAEPETYGGSGLVSWGNGLFDADLDGAEDLFVANGGSPPSKWPGMFGDDYDWLNPPYCYRNRKDLTFTETHEMVGITNETFHRSAAFSDYDDDGDIDVYFGSLEGFGSLYRNNLIDDGTDYHWLKVKVQGTVGNRDGIGARIVASVGDRTQMREVSGGSSFLSRHSLTSHIGLAGADMLDVVRVTFPGGLWYEARDVPADQTIVVVEPVVTVIPDHQTLAIQAGDSFQVRPTLTEHSGETQSLQAWIDLVSPGGDTTIRGPFAVTLGPGEALTPQLSFQTGSGLAAGTYTLVFRAGQPGGTLVHQSYLDIEVSGSGRASDAGRSRPTPAGTKSERRTAIF